MDIDDLIIDPERLADICTRFGVASLAVFGSVSRDEQAPESDLDLLYVLRPDAHLGWNIEQLADDLSELFGRRVDLVSRSALHARLREAVLADAQLLYAA